MVDNSFTDSNGSHLVGEGNGSSVRKIKKGLFIPSGRFRNVWTSGVLHGLGLIPEDFDYILGASSGFFSAKFFACGKVDDSIDVWRAQAKANHVRIFDGIIDRDGISRVSLEQLGDSYLKLSEGKFFAAVYDVAQNKTVYVPILKDRDRILISGAATSNVPGFCKSLRLEDFFEFGFDGGMNPLDNAQHLLDTCDKVLVIHNLPLMLDEGVFKRFYHVSKGYLENEVAMILAYRNYDRNISKPVNEILSKRMKNLYAAQKLFHEKSGSQNGQGTFNIHPLQHLKINPNSPNEEQVGLAYFSGQTYGRAKRKDVYEFLGISRNPELGESEQVLNVGRV